MRFSQFAGNTKFPRTEHGMGRRERFAQSVLTFKEDKRQCQIGKGRQRLFLIRAAAGEEPQKRERLRRDAAPGERRHGRTRPRNHRYGNPRRAAGPYQPVAGVGHQRQPGVGNKRKRPAFVQQAQHFVQLALFVMVMKAHEPLGFHPTALAQQPRPAGIFRKDHIRAFQHFPRTGRKITRVAKRRRHYP